MTDIPSETPAVPVDLEATEAAINQAAGDKVATATDDQVRTLFDYRPDANGNLVGPDGEPAPTNVVTTLAKLNEHPNSGGGILRAMFGVEAELSARKYEASKEGGDARVNLGTGPDAEIRDQLPVTEGLDTVEIPVDSQEAAAYEASKAENGNSVPESPSPEILPPTA